MWRHFPRAGSAASRQPEEALASYLRAIEIKKRLVRDNPNSTIFQFDLARGHFAIAVAQTELGLFADASENCRLALAPLERLVREDPTVPEYQTELARTLGSQANVERSLGQIPRPLLAFSARSGFFDN